MKFPDPHSIKNMLKKSTLLTWMALSTSTNTWYAGTDEIRDFGDMGIIINPLVASTCAFNKGKINDYLSFHITTVGGSSVTKKATWNLGTEFERPNNSRSAWFYSGHAAAASAWFVGTMKYCDSKWLKWWTGLISVGTTYSRVKKDSKNHSPHTELQAFTWFIIPILVEITWIQDGINNLLNDSTTFWSYIEWDRTLTGIKINF